VRAAVWLRGVALRPGDLDHTSHSHLLLLCRAQNDDTSFFGLCTERDLAAPTDWRFSSFPPWHARQIPTALGKRNTAANFTGERDRPKKQDRRPRQVQQAKVTPKRWTQPSVLTWNSTDRHQLSPDYNQTG
jgi:hypothetical protein